MIKEDPKTQEPTTLRVLLNPSESNPQGTVFEFNYGDDKKIMDFIYKRLKFGDTILIDDDTYEYEEDTTEVEVKVFGPCNLKDIIEKCENNTKEKKDA